MKRAGDVLGWGLRSETDSVIEFEVYTNWKSWGEEVIVSFGPGVIAIRSQCRWFLQCVDWGKNRKNCQILADLYASQ